MFPSRQKHPLTRQEDIDRLATRVIIFSVGGVSHFEGALEAVLVVGACIIEGGRSRRGRRRRRVRRPISHR